MARQGDDRNLLISTEDSPIAAPHEALPGQSGTSRFAYGVEANANPNSGSSLLSGLVDTKPTSDSTFGYGGPAGTDVRGPGAGPTGTPWPSSTGTLGATHSAPATTSNVGAGTIPKAEAFDSSTGDFVGRPT